MAKPFNELTNRGQARRLRSMALKALWHYELQAADVRLITNDMNGIFRIDAGNGERFILRIADPAGGHDGNSLRSEMMWLAALSRDTELSVPRPVFTKRGESVVRVSHPGVPQPRYCMLFGWVPGHDLADHMSEASLRELGKLSAQLHQHAAGFRPGTDFDILRFDKVFPFPEPVILFDKAYDVLFPAGRRALFQQAVEATQVAINRLQASGEPMRVIHGDLHQWNVRWHRGQLSPIDFEDLMWGWPVQDIATTLYYLLPYDAYGRWRSAFQEGYVGQCAWPERYPGEIDIFIAARGLGLVNFLLQDPDLGSPTEIPAYIELIENRLRRLLP